MRVVLWMTWSKYRFEFFSWIRERPLYLTALFRGVRPEHDSGDIKIYKSILFWWELFYGWRDWSINLNFFPQLGRNGCIFWHFICLSLSLSCMNSNIIMWINNIIWQGDGRTYLDTIHYSQNWHRTTSYLFRLLGTLTLLAIVGRIMCNSFHGWLKLWDWTKVILLCC